jgi:hypothetical protein
MFRKIVTLKISNEKHMSQFKIRKLNITASLKIKYYMAVHIPLNAFSFDISLIEIGQEIKLLEHLKKKLDHPVYTHFNFVQYIAAFISTVTKYYSSYVAVPFLRKITKI